MPLWRRSAKCAWSWRDWGADSVVYESHSGHTHQFAPLAAAVMACFEARACSLDDLVTTIAADLDTVADQALTSALSSIVENFHALGWLEATERG